MKAWPPGGVVGLPAVGVRAVPFSVGQAGAWARAGECENTPSAAATSAAPASTRAARAEEVMFEKRWRRPSSCAAGCKVSDLTDRCDNFFLRRHELRRSSLNITRGADSAPEHAPR